MNMPPHLPAWNKPGQNIIYIGNNTENPVSAMEQDRLSEGSENPRAVANQKDKTFHWYGVFCQINHKNYDDA